MSSFICLSVRIRNFLNYIILLGFLLVAYIIKYFCSLIRIVVAILIPADVLLRLFIFILSRTTKMILVVRAFCSQYMSLV